MPVVKIVNPKPYDWRGTQCFIDGNKVPRVKSVDFHVAVDEVPTFILKWSAWHKSVSLLNQLLMQF